MSRTDTVNSAATRIVAALVILMWAITFTACGSSSQPSQSNPTPSAAVPPGGNGGSGGTGSGGGSSSAGFAFVLNAVGHTVTAFKVNGDGSLSATSNSPIPVISNALGAGLAFAAGDLWVSTEIPAQLVSYQINSDGSLKQLNVTQTPNGGRLHAVGNFLYETTPSGQLLGYAVTSSGTANSVPGSPYTGPSGIIRDVAATADGKMLYATVGTATGDLVQAYLVNPDGSLTAQGSVPIGSPVDLSQGKGPHDSILAVAGSFVVTASPSDGSVRSFLIGSGGTLTPAGMTSIPDVPETIAASGSYVYVATSGRTVYSFFIGSGGSVTKVSQVDGGFAPSTMAATHNGSLYVLFYDPGELTAFSTSNGNLAPLPGSPYSGPGMKGNNPTGIAFSQ